MAAKKMRRYAEPYRQRGSIIRTAFRACQQGIKEVDLIEMVQKLGGNPIIVLKQIKVGQTGVFRWDVDDAKGTLKITNLRTVDKE